MGGGEDKGVQKEPNTSREGVVTIFCGKLLQSSNFELKMDSFAESCLP